MAIRFGCQIDFDNDGQYEAAEDVSADLRRLEFRRGRGYSPLTLWRAATGRATVVLRNTSGDYSPSNRNGPYFGNFRPGRRLRILWAEGSGALVPAWSGFMTAPDIRPRLSSVNQTLLRAEGPFAILNREIVHVIGALGRTEGDAINAVLDAAGWPAVDRDIDDGVLTELGLHWVGGISALEAMRQVAATGLGVLFEGRDGKVVYQNRRRRLTPPYNVAAYRFGDYPGVLPYGEPREHDGLAGILNKFEAEVRSYSVGAAAAEVWSSSEPSARVGVNEQITLIAQSAAVGRVGVLDWTDPVVADFTMKANADGSGADVPFSVAAFRKFFSRMEIDLLNTGQVAGFATAARAHGKAVTQNQSEIVPGGSTVSQNAYGTRPYVLPARFFANQQDARDAIGFTTELYKDPTARLTMPVDTRRSTAVAQAVLGIDTPSRISVTAANASGLGIAAADYFVESEVHVASPQEHRVRYELAPAGGTVTFWILGIGRLGVGTRLA